MTLTDPAILRLQTRLDEQDGDIDEILDLLGLIATGIKALEAEVSTLRSEVSVLKDQIKFLDGAQYT